MENDKHRQSNKIKLMRTIDNKRTISSEQGHYARSQHQRKFTIQYFDPKKSMRQPLVQRKNQSLPKHLINPHNNNQHQIRSRKLIYSSHSVHNDHKSSNKTIPTQINQTESAKTDYSKSTLFCDAIDKFKQGKFQIALHKFLAVEQQIKDVFPKNIYYIGLCYWNLNQKQKSVFFLSKALDLQFPFSTQSYDLLSNFYESTKNYNCALKTLDQWLKEQSSSKGFLMRARIHFQFKQYEKAINDYLQCYRIEPTKLEAYIEEAQATYRLQGVDAAMEKYNQLLVSYNSIWPESKHSDINYVKYKKSLILIQQKNYPPALSLLKQVSNPELQSQVSYYIGVIHSVLGQFQQAILAFTKAIQANTSQKFVGQSYYQKFVLMFKKNDFYGIQHELDIIDQNFIDNEPLEMMRKVIEGVIFILKMNFKDGIKTFGQLEKNQCYLRNIKIYQSTISSFKIFAFYSMHMFEQAFQQFGNMKSKRTSESNRYNLTMLKAIKATFSKQYNEALNLFEQAEKIQPFNTHTFMAKAVVEVLFYNSLHSVKLQQKKVQQQVNEQILLSAEQLLNRCLQKQPQNDQILYLLSVINYELSQYESGIKLIRKAIDVSDDHTIKHYYLKANLKVMLNMEGEAISDYSNAILVMNEQENMKAEQLEDNAQTPIPECYLERAKCYILEGSLDRAQADLRAFFSNLTNVKKYRHELELFTHVGCSNVILQIYKSILEEEYDPYSKMKCYYLAKELNNCLNMMNIMLEFSPDDNSEDELNYNPEQLIIDRDCLEALKKSSQGSNILIQSALATFEEKIQQHAEGQIFKKADLLFYAGVMQFHLQQYGKAKNYFIDAKGQKLLINQIANGGQSIESNQQNQLFSLQQINYNIGLCDFIQGKWSNYLQIYPEFKKNHQSVTQNLLIESQEITPFTVKNRLCSIYPPEKIGSVSFRLSFCLPKIRLKQVKFNKNPYIIKNIGFNDIDMRPSAPWIQKNKKGIMFTSDILKQSIDLKSEKSKKGAAVKKKTQQRYKELQPI